MEGKNIGQYAIALALAVVGALWLGVSVTTLAVLAIVLLCPLMMFLMMHGMQHGADQQRHRDSDDGVRDTHEPHDQTQGR